MLVNGCDTRISSRLVPSVPSPAEVENELEDILKKNGITYSAICPLSSSLAPPHPQSPFSDTITPTFIAPASLGQTTNVSPVVPVPSATPFPAPPFPTAQFPPATQAPLPPFPNAPGNGSSNPPSNGVFPTL